MLADSGAAVAFGSSSETGDKMGNSMATKAVTYGAERTASSTVNKADNQLDSWSQPQEEEKKDALSAAMDKVVGGAQDLMDMERRRQRDVQRHKAVSKNRKQSDDIRAKYGIKR